MQHSKLGHASFPTLGFHANLVCEQDRQQQAGSPIEKLRSFTCLAVLPESPLSSRLNVPRSCTAWQVQNLFSLATHKPPEPGGLSSLDKNPLGNLVALPTSLALSHSAGKGKASHMIFGGSVQRKPHIRHFQSMFKELQQSRHTAWRALVE